jgi:hypothetical protein
MRIQSESSTIEPFRQLLLDKLFALERGFQVLMQGTVDCGFLYCYFFSLSSRHAINLSEDGISLSLGSAKTFLLGGDSSLLEYPMSSSSAIRQRWPATLSFRRGFIVMIDRKGLCFLGGLEGG